MQTQVIRGCGKAKDVFEAIKKLAKEKGDVTLGSIVAKEKRQS